MKILKPVGIGLLIFVCIGGFFVWRVYPKYRPERVTLPMVFHFKGRTYAEIRPRLIQKNNISLIPVTSCEGLTELGPLDDAGEETSRGLADAQYDWVTIPDTAYLYPDPDYPFLAVAFIDGSPAYFELTDAEYMTAGEMQKLYGSLPVKKLIIRDGSDQSKKRTITDPDSIAQLFDAINSLPQDLWGHGGGSLGVNPLCAITAVLSNGCQVELSYFPKEPDVPYSCNATRIGPYFESNEAIDTWIADHFK